MRGVSWFGPSIVPEWGALASALQLNRFEPTGRYSEGTTFRQLMRGIGVRATGEPTSSHWLYGERGGTPVLVLHYSVPNGKHSRELTGVIACIDPPLRLGLSAIVRDRSFMDGLLGGDRALLGDPAVDDHLSLKGNDRSRVAALLSIYEPDSREVIAHLLALAPLEVHVMDSLVLIAKAGSETDPQFIGALIDRGVWLANAFAARRRKLPATPREHATYGEWQTFADAHGLRFDPERMKLVGNLDGCAVEMSIEIEERILRTTVTVRFPSPVPLAFTATRCGGGLGFMQGDIKIGDEAFDDMFTVGGSPEADVRGLLDYEDLLVMLKEIGRRTTEVYLNQTQLYFSLESDITQPPQWQWLAQTVQTTMTALFAPRTYR